MLDDSNIDVQICASAAICNLVLGFSATAKDIIAKGGIKRIVKLLYSEEVEVRCNGLWALNNLVSILELFQMYAIRISSLY